MDVEKKPETDVMDQYNFLSFTHQHNLMAAAWSHIRQTTAGFTAVTCLEIVRVETDIARAQNSCSRRDINFKKFD